MTLPARYRDAKYEHVPAEIREKFEAMRETRRGLYIHGPVGSGKTHILYALYAAVEEKVKGPKEFWNTTQLLHALRADFDRPWRQKQHIDEELMDIINDH
jgi:DNA replication protein DnaC